MKICKDCTEEKSLSDFNKNPNGIQEGKLNEYHTMDDK